MAWGCNLAGWKPHAEFLASATDWCETPACTASDFGQGIMWTSQWSPSRIATGAGYEGDPEKAEKNVHPALSVGWFFFFLWIFLLLLSSLSSPVFLGKPSPHVDVRIILHLCLCEDKFILLLLWVCPSSSSDVLLSFFPPYCFCPFTPVSFEHIQYGQGWMCSFLRNLSDLCFDYFFSPPEMSLHLLFFKDKIGWSDSH